MTRCLPLLGSFVEIYIQADVADNDLIKASQKGFDVINLIQKKMSFHDPLSELSIINSNAFNSEIQMSEMTKQVIEFSYQLSTLTEGIFDITTAALLLKNQQIPNHSNLQSENIGYKDIILDRGYIKFIRPLTLDLGGIAKGFAVDKALQVIINELESQIKQIYINAGGDLKYHDWQNENILVPNITKKTHLIKMLNAAIATSSSYYINGVSDIYHPSTKQQAIIEKTISVFADSCMHADGLTKVAALISDDHPVFKQLNAQVIYT